MKLLIIRHGDPNYSIDSLTEKGWREAEYLSERLSGMDIKKFYVSSMGRAKDTASFTLKKMGRSAEECKWLREFAPLICHPGCERSPEDCLGLAASGLDKRRAVLSEGPLV